VASRDIKPWEAVIQDKALVVAPGDHPLCILCLGDLGGGEGSTEVAKCNGCGWPICPACNELTDGPGGTTNSGNGISTDESLKEANEVRGWKGFAEAHREECLLFQEQEVRPTLLETGQRHWLYPALGVIRMLLLRKDSDSWKRVGGLMDHWDEWRGMPQVVEASLRLGNFLQQRLGIECTQEEVEHCWGVLQTNSISIGGGSGRGLFPLVSLLSHSCKPCLEPAVSPSGQAGITLRARRTIKAGEELTMPYTDVLREVRARQENLAKEWHFTCTCPRCSDPTDGGSFFSSLQCCCGGFAIRQEAETQWQCSVCGSDLSDMASQEAMVDKLGRALELTTTMDDIKQLVDQVDKVEGLHANHWLRLRANIRFCDLMATISNEEIAKQVATKSEAALATLAMVDPGLSKMAGRLMVAGSSAEQRLLLLRARQGQMGGGQRALAEVLKKRTRGLAMLSSFCILGKTEAKG